MTSSKKKRGKQRKAAKLAAANHDGDATPSRCNNTNFVDCVRKGDGDITRILSDRKLHDKNKKSIIVLSKNVRSGKVLLDLSDVMNHVLPVVLVLLQRCEDEKFDEVMAHVSKDCDVGGDLDTPSTWIKILLTAISRDPSCHLQVVQNIGPLVRCMCGDTKRVFFKSNKHWKEAILSFVELIDVMIMGRNESGSGTESIVDTLLQNEGLLRTIVQWEFWEEEYRPDITKELNEEDCTNIVNWGREITNQLVEGATDTSTQKDKIRLEIIVTTPIVCKDYDPSCMVSYIAGLIRHLKDDKCRADNNLYELFSSIDCVDKGVITEIIEFGINCANNYEMSSYAASLLRVTVVKETIIQKEYQPNDTRLAFAIRAGLIEMCLDFVERFLEENISQQLHKNLDFILGTVLSVSLHKKSAKAIRSKRSTIEDRLVRLEQKSNIANNTKCRELLDMVRSVLYLNGAYCCRCNKSLGRKEIKRCNGCNLMTYCSKACQKKDWLNGHNLTCCNKHYTVEQAGVFQGRCCPIIEPENERAAAKLEALEVNMTMIQLKLFLDNAETIRDQASYLNISLRDCVVIFDLRNWPFGIKTKRYTEEFFNLKERKAFEDSRSKENIICIYISDFFNGELDEDGYIPFLEMQRFFPHEWLLKRERKS